MDKPFGFLFWAPLLFVGFVFGCKGVVGTASSDAAEQTSEGEDGPNYGEHNTQNEDAYIGDTQTDVVSSEEDSQTADPLDGGNDDSASDSEYGSYDQSDPPADYSDDEDGMGYTDTETCSSCLEDCGSCTEEPISDLGCAIVTDTIQRQRPDIAKPGYLESYIDPVFGSKITRITGDPGTLIVYEDAPTDGTTWPDVCRHEYSKQQAWNADQSIIWLTWCGTSKMLSGKTYKPLKLLTRPPYSHEIHRWHPTEPQFLVYTYYDGTTDELGKWNVYTGMKTVINTFTGYGALYFGPGEGNISKDGKMIALYSMDTQKAFAYDMVNKIRWPDIDLSMHVEIDWVSISANGQYVVVNVYRDSTGTVTDSTLIYDLDGHQVGPYWSTFGCPSHYDLTTDEQGNEVAAGTCKSDTETYQNSGIIKRNLMDGAITTIGYRAWGNHTTARNINRPFFVYVSNPLVDPYLNEILSIKLDGSVIQRLAWIPNNNVEDGATSPVASPSPDGRKVIIASNWNLGTRPVQAYIIEICPHNTP